GAPHRGASGYGLGSGFGNVAEKRLGTARPDAGRTGRQRLAQAGAGEGRSGVAAQPLGGHSGAAAAGGSGPSPLDRGAGGRGAFRPAAGAYAAAAPATGGRAAPGRRQRGDPARSASAKP